MKHLKTLKEFIIESTVNEEDLIKNNTENLEDKELEKIRYFKGSAADLKAFFDQKAGRNTNAFETPVYQGFDNVHPTRGETKSPHWKESNKK